MPGARAPVLLVPSARPALLWPPAVPVKAQDELATLGLDGCPRRPIHPNIRAEGTSKTNRTRTLAVFPFARIFPWCYGPELTSRHFLAWCIENKIELVHIQPGKPTQNAHVESFHGKLREECLRVSWFQNLFDARRKIALWRHDYNEQRPHSSLNYRTPAEFAHEASYGKDAGCAHLENAYGVSHFPTASAAAG